MDSLKTRKIIIALAVLAVAAAFSAASYFYTSANQNEPGDFRGLKWGSDQRKLSGLKLLAEDGELRFYQKDNDSMKLGGAEVDKIVYGFHRGRFYSVLAYFSSPDAYTVLKENFQREYGEPIQSDQNAGKCFWNGDTVSVLLTFEDPSHAGRIAFFFKPIQMEAEMSRPSDLQ